MIKPTVAYQLDPDHDGPAVSFTDDGAALVNIWQLRDKVLQELSKSGTKIWRDETCPLPEVYLELANLK